MDHMWTPLEIKILKSVFCMIEGTKKRAQIQMSMNLGLQMVRVDFGALCRRGRNGRRDDQNGVITYVDIKHREGNDVVAHL